MIDKGILLMCYGSSTYGKYAYNMAYSIKHFNSTFHIHLICDSISIGNIDIGIFDSIEIIDFQKEDVGDRGLSKIKLLDRSPFNKTLYLDVDGICLSDPQMVFDKVSKFPVFSQALGSGSFQDSISGSGWASNEIIWNKYGLKEDSIFPALQTSLIYFDRSKKAIKFFEKLKVNYTKRLDRSEYIEMWGKSAQHPDELYYGVTMAQMGINPNKSIQPVFFPNKHESISTIERDYLILSMWGNNLAKPYAKEYYDRVMFKVMASFSKNHFHKAHKLYQGKFTGIS